MSDTDPRTGPEDSGSVQIVSADGNTPQTVYTVPSTALFRVEEVKIEYDDSATVDAALEIHDNADGTAAADLDDRRDRWVNINSAGDRIETDGSYRVFENAVLAATDGNQDGPLEVTVKGTLLTDLADVSGQF